MLFYCLKCRKNTENENPEISKIKNEEIMLIYRCAMCSSKKSKLMKKREASGLLC